MTSYSFFASIGLILAIACLKFAYNLGKWHGVTIGREEQRKQDLGELVRAKGIGYRAGCSWRMSRTLRGEAN